jgi:hypothetical protein
MQMGKLRLRTMMSLEDHTSTAQPALLTINLLSLGMAKASSGHGGFQAPILSCRFIDRSQALSKCLPQKRKPWEFCKKL